MKPNRARRLLRRQDELFQFLLVPGLPAHNNPVERSLRPPVIMRKISGGTRSPAGSQTRLTLASVFDTWTARHLNPFRQCLAALQPPPPMPRPELLYPNSELLHRFDISRIGGRLSCVAQRVWTVTQRTAWFAETDALLGSAGLAGRPTGLVFPKQQI